MLVLKDSSGQPLAQPPAPTSFVFGKTGYVEIDSSVLPPYWREWDLEYRWATNNAFIDAEWTALASIPRPVLIYSHTLPYLAEPIYIQYRYRVKNALDITEWSIEGNATHSNFESSPTTGLSRYSTNFGNGVDTVFNFNHNLNSVDLVSSIFYNTSPYEEVIPSKEKISSNTLRVTFSKPPATNEFRVVIIG